MKWGCPFGEPSARRLHPGMSQGMGENPFQLLLDGLGGIGIGWVGLWGADGGDEQRAGFVGGVLWAGQVEEGERGARVLAEPTLEEGRDAGGGVGPRRNSGLVFGADPERGVGGGVRDSHGSEEAGGVE